MSLRKTLEKHKNTLVVVVPAVIILLPLAYNLVAFVFAKEAPGSPPLFERPDPKHEACVRDAEYMRYHHMDLLQEIREDFVRHGNRGEIRLSTCRDCHVSRERFCNRCHGIANVQLDCFGCHYYPEPTETEGQPETGI